MIKKQQFFFNMTAQQYREMMGGPRQPVQKESKYHAQKTEVDGIKFDSKWEAERYSQLSAMQRAGQIKDLQRQVKFVLQDGYVNNKGEKIRPICYLADFQYTDNEGRQIVEDTKSPATKTDVFKIKKKLFEAKFKDYIFIEKYKK
jgi:hypothetical protein